MFLNHVTKIVDEGWISVFMKEEIRKIIVIINISYITWRRSLNKNHITTTDCWESKSVYECYQQKANKRKYLFIPGKEDSVGWKLKASQSVNHKNLFALCVMLFLLLPLFQPLSVFLSPLNFLSFRIHRLNSTRIHPHSFSSSCTFIFNFKSINQHNRLILISLSELLQKRWEFPTIAFAYMMPAWNHLCMPSMKGVVGGIDFGSLSFLFLPPSRRLLTIAHTAIRGSVCALRSI